MLLITEVLEWFNSASMPYFLFEHRSLIKYYINQRIFLPKYATLNPNFTAHSMPSFKFDNVFYVPNFPFFRQVIAKSGTTVMILPTSSDQLNQS